MNVLLVSYKKNIKFPNVEGVVNSIRCVKTYISEIDRWHVYDVILVDESVDDNDIKIIRDDFDKSIIIGTGPDKKLVLDFGLNAYLQRPYTQDQLFQAIALGGLTHYLLVTYPLAIRDKLQKKGIYCL